MMTTYNQLREEYNKRYKMVQKNANRLSDTKKLEKMLIKRNLDNQNGLELLSQENDSISKSMQLADTIIQTGISVDEELDTQDKVLKNNKNRLETILSKIPIIQKVLSSINFHKYKEKIILGLVVGIIIFVGLYLTYY
jgi:hypothetical protein